MHQQVLHSLVIIQQRCLAGKNEDLWSVEDIRYLK